MIILSLLLVVGSFVFSFVFLFAGKRIVRAIPAVASFRHSKKVLQEVQIGHKQIRRGQAFSGFCAQEIDDLLTWGNTDPHDVAKLKKITMGAAATLAHYKEIALNSTIRELQTYSFFILVLGFVGIAGHLSESNFEFSWPIFLKWMTDNPFQIIDLFKITLIVLFSIRLLLEYLSLRELLSE